MTLSWGTGLPSMCQLPTYSTDAGTDAALLEKLCVDFAEVRDLLKKGTAFFVDVREPNELVNDGRIRDAVNIPLNDVGTALSLPAEKFKEKYGREKPSQDNPNLIFSCRKGVRATNAMQTAHSKGYHKARFYRGSFCDWVEKGGEVLKK
uniref:Putative member of the rhodanese logy domain superfamily n=2 Tax=Ixodes ricinus TaxID=34613 RepID=A0A0K8R9W9_IXORI